MKKKLACFIEENEQLSSESRTYWNVCSVDPSEKPMVVHVHDIRANREEAEDQLKLVKAGKHPTQTHPAGSLWLYKGE